MRKKMRTSLVIFGHRLGRIPVEICEEILWNLGRVYLTPPNALERSESGPLEVDWESGGSVFLLLLLSCKWWRLNRGFD